MFPRFRQFRRARGAWPELNLRADMIQGTLPAEFRPNIQRYGLRGGGGCGRFSGQFRLSLAGGEREDRHKSNR